METLNNKNLPFIHYKDGTKEQLIPENLIIKYLFKEENAIGYKFSKTVQVNKTDKEDKIYLFKTIDKIE